MEMVSAVVILNTTMLLLSATVTSIQSCIIMKDLSKHENKHN